MLVVADLTSIPAQFQEGSQEFVRVGRGGGGGGGGGPKRVSPPTPGALFWKKKKIWGADGAHWAGRCRSDLHALSANGGLINPNR